MKTNEILSKGKQKEVYYFSMEFLMGRLITNNIQNLGLRPLVEKAFSLVDMDLNEIEHYESDAGLGNGGLGRLAACFLDSIASMGLPGYGNGIRYRYGLFEQRIVDGYQIEKPDDWLKDGYVWEVRKEELETRSAADFLMEATYKLCPTAQERLWTAAVNRLDQPH